MTIAWLFFAAVGTTTARHFKQLMPNTKPFGLPLWFALHRPAMYLCVLLSLAGALFTYLYVGGFCGFLVDGWNPHPILGILTLVGAIAQPIMAFFRPHPGEGKRWLFNIAHLSVGWSTFALAEATVTLGTHLKALVMPRWAMLLMYAFIAYDLIMDGSLESIRYKIKRDGESPQLAQTKSVLWAGHIGVCLVVASAMLIAIYGVAT